MGESNFRATYTGSLSAGVPACDLTLDQLDAYHRGAQPLSFLHPEVAAATGSRLRSLSVNWCRLIVGSIEERLDVEGFRLGQGAVDPRLWAIWQANDLDEWSQQCHVDALVHGRSFVMVWPDRDDPKRPRITVESAQQMTVELDPITREVVRAVKEWRAGEKDYRTVYLPDRIEKYVSEDGDTWVEREAPMENPLGVVPVVPFVNRPRITLPLGESELTDVIPLVDAVNKLSTDMMVSAEHHAMPRRWATGVELPGDREDRADAATEYRAGWTNAAPGDTWLTDSPEARFGQFASATLDNYVAAVNLFTKQIAALAGLPPHFLGHSSDNPASADAIRSAEGSLVKKARRKQRVFGGSWERVMRLAARVADLDLTGAESLETVWRNPETPSVAQATDAAVKLHGIGVPLPTLLEGLGYTPQQIEHVERLRSAQPETSPAELAAMVQKVYLGVGPVLSSDEARALLNKAGAGLSPTFLAAPPAPPAVEAA